MQQVNLYQPAPKPTFNPLAARSILLFFCLGMVALGGVNFYISHQQQEANKQLQQLKATEIKRQQQVGLLNVQYQTKKKSPQLDHKISMIQADQSSKEHLINKLAERSFANKDGFSESIKALARQILSGKLWLTGFTFSESGKHVQLDGGALKGSYIPRYLQKLSSEATFKGKQFHTFQLTKPKDVDNYIAFSMGTYPPPDTAPKLKTRVTTTADRLQLINAKMKKFFSPDQEK